MTEVYAWLVANEQMFIDDLTPDVSRILKEIEIFKDADVDLTGYIDELMVLIQEYVEASIMNNFNLSPEDYLIAKEDHRIKKFIEDLQKIVINKDDMKDDRILH